MLFFYGIQDIPQFIEVVESLFAIHSNFLHDSDKHTRIILLFAVNPVRNSSRSTQRLSTGGALNPALRGGTPYGAEPGIILKSNPVAAARPEGLSPSHEAL
jgi:hypothetical protein